MPFKRVLFSVSLWWFQCAPAINMGEDGIQELTQGLVILETVQSLYLCDLLCQIFWSSKLNYNSSSNKNYIYEIKHSTTLTVIIQKQAGWFSKVAR